jgi:hypothetical protein
MPSLHSLGGNHLYRFLRGVAVFMPLHDYQGFGPKRAVSLLLLRFRGQDSLLRGWRRTRQAERVRTICARVFSFKTCPSTSVGAKNHGPSCPICAVQRPILNGLCNMLCLNLVGTVQVSNSSGDLEDTIAVSPGCNIARSSRRSQ